MTTNAARFSLADSRHVSVTLLNVAVALSVGVPSVLYLRALRAGTFHVHVVNALCTMLLRAINAVDYAVAHPDASPYTQWRANVQGGFIRDLNGQGAGFRIAGTDFF